MAITYILDDMATFLVAYNSGALGLTLGTNLFEGLLPNKPDTAVALYEYSGSPAEYVMGAANPLPAFAHPHLQIVVRSGGNSPYEPGRVLIESCMRALETIVNTQIGTSTYYRVERNQDPFLMHRDSIRRTFFGCNFSVTQKPSS